MYRTVRSRCILSGIFVDPVANPIVFIIIATLIITRATRPGIISPDQPVESIVCIVYRDIGPDQAAGQGDFSIRAAGDVTVVGRPAPELHAVVVGPEAVGALRQGEGDLPIGIRRLGVVLVSGPIESVHCQSGARRAAGLAVGFWKDYDELRANWGKDKERSPSMPADRRESRYAGWKKAVTRTFDWVT